jgi:hypothetical protein
MNLQAGTGSLEQALGHACELTLPPQVLAEVSVTSGTRLDQIAPRATVNDDAAGTVVRVRLEGRLTGGHWSSRCRSCLSTGITSGGGVVTCAALVG